MRIGTVLPTPASLAADDAYASRVAATREAAAATLAHCERRTVAGESRFYASADRYAIVNRAGRVLWFRVTPDGDFSI